MAGNTFPGDPRADHSKCRARQETLIAVVLAGVGEAIGYDNVIAGWQDDGITGKQSAAGKDC